MERGDGSRGSRVAACFRLLASVSLTLALLIPVGLEGAGWAEEPGGTGPTCDPATEECDQTPSPEPSPPSPSPQPPPEHDDRGNKPPGGDGGSGGPSRPPVRRGPEPEPAEDVCSVEGALHPSGVASTTAPLQPIVRKLVRRGVARGEALARLAGPFPVMGQARWSDDWHALRCVPTAHLHKGVDIFAARGTRVAATATGTVTRMVNGAVSGLGLEIRDAGGTEYFFAHLDGFADGLRAGDRVSVGDLIGFVGDTGNARGTSPHIHLEVQPGGIAAPPKPYVDRWLDRAKTRGMRMIRRIDARARRRARSAHLTPTWGPALEDPFMPPPAPHPLEVLGLSPELTGSPILVVYAVAHHMAADIDWDGPDPGEILSREVAPSPRPVPWLEP